MPHNFSTLLMPATIAREETIRQLLLYFETVFLYSPTEDPPPALAPEFAALCRHYAPAPFGKHLANFKQLIRDMTGHRAEYYGGGLSRLSAKTSAVDEESVWRLISRLSPQATGRTQDEALFQARLLLRLAEIRDQEEEEIEKTLTEIESQGQAMLHGLSEEDDDEHGELTALIRHERQAAGDTLEQRLRAWTRLFLADPRMGEHWLFATSPEVLAILTEHATTRLDEAPARLLSLPLPGATLMELAPADYLRERAAWRQETGTLLAALAVGLKQAATSGAFVPDDSIRAQLAACPQKMMARGNAPQATLDIHLLPVSLTALLAKIAKAPVPEAAAPPLPHGLVAVIRPA